VSPLTLIIYAGREKIRTLKIEEQIEKGEKLKKIIKNLIGNICYQ